MDVASHLSQPAILASYVEKLIQQGNFRVVNTIDGNYNHMGATVADAVLQANLRYETHVRRRIKRILDDYQEAKTTSAVLALLETVSVRDFLNWNEKEPARRANRFMKILALFKDEAIETEKELNRRLSDDQSGVFVDTLRQIEGIGPKTVDYFKILVGISTSAIDRHLLTFISNAGISVSKHPDEYENASRLINATADLMQIDRAIFDHSIWRHMSEKAAKAKSKAMSCDGGFTTGQKATAPAACLNESNPIDIEHNPLPPGWQRGLLPIIDDNSTILVLGTFPSTQSLLRQEYYAGLGNRFWCLVGEIFGYEGDLRQQDYAVKKKFLIDHGVALWDVAESALRVGAADNAIQAWRANDLPGLLQRYPGISRIILNGGKSEEMFNAAQETFGQEIPPRTIPLQPVRCGSTSGANQHHFPCTVLFHNWQPHFSTHQ